MTTLFVRGLLTFIWTSMFVILLTSVTVDNAYQNMKSVQAYADMLLINGEKTTPIGLCYGNKCLRDLCIADVNQTKYEGHISLSFYLGPGDFAKCGGGNTIKEVFIHKYGIIMLCVCVVCMVIHLGTTVSINDYKYGKYFFIAFSVLNYLIILGCLFYLQYDYTYYGVYIMIVIIFLSNCVSNTIDTLVIAKKKLRKSNHTQQV